jgi:hypothetical protein
LKPKPNRRKPNGFIPRTPPAGWKNWPANPTPAERRQQLDDLRHVVAAARRVTQGIRDYFPVGGAEWPFRKHSDGYGLTKEVFDRLFYLERLLYPARSAREARDESVRDFHYVIPPGLWPEFTVAVRQIADRHNALLKHYGWTSRIALHQGWTGLAAARHKTLGAPWKWPRVPPLSPDPLTFLDGAANLLERHIEEYTERFLPQEDSPAARSKPSPGRTPEFDDVVRHAHGLLTRDPRMRWGAVHDACMRQFGTKHMPRGGDFAGFSVHVLKRFKALKLANPKDQLRGRRGEGNPE